MKINKKILIAEDELLIAKVLCLQFEKLGYEVQNVTDASDVFYKVKEMLPDIIILDVHLKNKSSGIDAAKQIRESGIATPIIFTTGNSYDNTVNLVKDINNSKVLNKPVEFEQLIQLIERI